jgi:hypothetical protein
MTWPAHLNGHARKVVGNAKQKCYRRDCITHGFTMYGPVPYCQRHAYEESIAERYSKPQAVAR